MRFREDNEGEVQSSRARNYCRYLISRPLVWWPVRRSAWSAAADGGWRKGRELCCGCASAEIHDANNMEQHRPHGPVARPPKVSPNPTPGPRPTPLDRSQTKTTRSSLHLLSQARWHNRVTPPTVVSLPSSPSPESRAGNTRQDPAGTASACPPRADHNKPGPHTTSEFSLMVPLLSSSKNHQLPSARKNKKNKKNTAFCIAPSNSPTYHTDVQSLSWQPRPSKSNHRSSPHPPLTLLFTHHHPPPPRTRQHPSPPQP